MKKCSRRRLYSFRARDKRGFGTRSRSTLYLVQHFHTLHSSQSAPHETAELLGQVLYPAKLLNPKPRPCSRIPTQHPATSPLCTSLTCREPTCARYVLYLAESAFGARRSQLGPELPREATSQQAPSEGHTCGGFGCFKGFIQF